MVYFVTSPIFGFWILSGPYLDQVINYINTVQRNVILIRSLTLSTVQLNGVELLNPTDIYGCTYLSHDDVIKWKHFPRYWPFVRGIHRSPVNSPHKGQWRGALKFSLICARINDWVNNGEAGDLRRNRSHYDVIVMYVLTLQVMLVKRPRSGTAGPL